MKKNKKHLKIFPANIVIAIVGIFFILIAGIHAQQPPPTESQSNSNIKIIELKHSDLLYKRKDFDAQILKNNVILYHEGAFMYCDSAYWYEQKNTFEAFSNVRMEQGDTIFVYGIIFITTVTEDWHNLGKMYVWKILKQPFYR